MALSNYLRAALLNATYRGTAYTPPSAFEVSAHTDDPGPDGDLNEVTALDYARVTGYTGGFSAPAAVAAPDTGQQVTNLAVMEFTDGATSNWGEIAWVVIRDQDGNPLHIAQLTVPQPVVTGNPVRFEVGALTLILD